MEKQKARFMFGITEKQFRRYYKKADRSSEVTGEQLLRLLELRMDNVVYRMGLASSRTEARQIVRHKLVKVDGNIANIPSFRVRVGARLELVDSAKEHLRINAAAEAAGSRGTAEWMDVDLLSRQGVYREMPVRDQLDQGIREQLIVELYSK